MTSAESISEPTAQSGWQQAQIVDIKTRTSTIKSFWLKLATPFSFRAGQHVDVRLTAPDGYTAMRSYSIASAPDESATIEISIERLERGEVSPFFHEIAQVGDDIELRGPLGGYFIWPQNPIGSVLLIGAGSGVVPLMAMARYHSATSKLAPVLLFLSARSWSDVLFRDELLELERRNKNFAFVLTLTRDTPQRPGDFNRRVDKAIIAEVITRLPSPPRDVFICGSNAFVDIASDSALAAGLPETVIKTERYGA